jgi:multidrug resistance efflux pump
VRADVVPVAPDVSGFVTEVLVRDNQQVQRGDVLFRIDRARYDIALKQAEAVLLGKRAMLDEANADLERYSALTPGVVVSKQRMDQVVATQGTAQAAFGMRRYCSAWPVAGLSTITRSHRLRSVCL